MSKWNFGCQIRYLELHEIHESAIKTTVFAQLKDRLTYLAMSRKDDKWQEIYKGLQDYAMTMKNCFLECMVEPNALPEWEQVLLACVGRAVGLKRIDQLYEMVSDYPNSRRAVSDLKTSLNLAHIQETEIIAAFTDQVKRHLLQAGAATQDIIYHFLIASKMFAEIGPNSIRRSDRIQSYTGAEFCRQSHGIRRRDIQSLLTRSDRYNEMHRFCFGRYETADAVRPGRNGRCTERCLWRRRYIFLPLCQQMRYHMCPVDEEISFKALKEMQRITNAGQQTASKQHNHETVYDIVSTLLGVYSSKEQFTEEYQKLLAEKLMTRMDYNCDRECRIFDLLKKRFNDPKLSDCEVMIHDIIQSKGLNPVLRKELDKTLAAEMEEDAAPQRPLNISALLISYLYWPEPKEPQIQLPPEVQHALDVYAKEFSTLKPPRTLNWRTGAGIVELDVTIGETTRSFTVDPVLACIILKFRPDKPIKETDLAKDIGLTVPVLRSRMTYWINNGILHEIMEDGEIWYQRRSEMEHPSDPIVEDSDEDVMHTTESRESDSGKFVCFRAYIMEFLRQRGDMPTTLEDIFRHLEKFVKQHTFDMSQVELSEYLESLAIERVISQTNGLYRIRN